MAKADFIKVMFDEISGNYDLLNDTLSFGTHRLWKSGVVREAMKDYPSRVLDCATGTGDLAFLFEKQGCKDITGIDFSPEMINLAQEKSRKIGSSAKFFTADILNLPFVDKSFDVTTVSFGIRNVEDIAKGIKELSRVSRTLLILEFGQPSNKLLEKAYFRLLKLYVPIFGMISGRKDAYEYLIASSQTFPSGEDFIQIMKQNSDHQQFSCQPIFGGIAYLYRSSGRSL